MCVWGGAQGGSEVEWVWVGYILYLIFVDQLRATPQDSGPHCLKDTISAHLLGWPDCRRMREPGSRNHRHCEDTNSMLQINLKTTQ